MHLMKGNPLVQSDLFMQGKGYIVVILRQALELS
jgi:hypothetical protein